MNYFKLRASRKELQEVLHYAKHIRHMHEDIADAKLFKQLVDAEAVAHKALKEPSAEAMRSAGEAILVACKKVAPPRAHPKVRENIEVIFVALAAAMAIRAYFFQPFKIPTGSMQPTLYGITILNQETVETAALPARVVRFFTKGEVFLHCDTPFDRFAKKMTIGMPYTLRADASGVIQSRHTANGEVPMIYRDNFNNQNGVITIGNTPQSIPGGMIPYCRFGEQLEAGEPLLRGVAKAGDYILVNRMKYNFVHPKRGDITVFDTRNLNHSQVRTDAYYIKRMVGEPNETLSLAPPYLLVNGEKPTDPRFDKLFNSDKYNGYSFAPMSQLATPNDSIRTAADEYLFFGDNTSNSLDGRYFGPVNRRQILGSAFLVCLPFDRAGWAEKK